MVDDERSLLPPVRHKTHTVGRFPAVAYRGRVYRCDVQITFGKPATPTKGKKRRGKRRKVL